MKHLLLILTLALFSCKEKCDNSCGDVIEKEVTGDSVGILYIITYVDECGDTINYHTRNINMYVGYNVGDQICL